MPVVSHGLFKFCKAKDNQRKELSYQKYINDSKKIVDEFNNFFGTIAKNIGKKTPPSKKQFSDYLRNSNINSLLLNPVKEKEISEIISKISARKAVGPNSIPNGILKKEKDILKVP